ncbi:hypothetical protein ABPG75_005305 [Micractinium tetrahymenae]
MGLCQLPPCIITEYCPRESLYDVLKQASQRPDAAAELTWRRRLIIALDAARGLLYLHLSEPPILHCDVKSPNILVDESWHAKICDFNLSEILRRRRSGDEGTAACNPTWLAPEVLDGGRAEAASDIYAFGMLLTWQLPWRGLTPFQVRRAVLDGRRPEVPPALPVSGAEQFAGLEAYCQLMRDCWAHEPTERPGLDAVAHQLSVLLEGLA